MKYLKLVLLLYFTEPCLQKSDDFYDSSVEGNHRQSNPLGTLPETSNGYYDVAETGDGRNGVPHGIRLVDVPCQTPRLATKAPNSKQSNNPGHVKAPAPSYRYSALRTEATPPSTTETPFTEFAINNLNSNVSSDDLIEQDLEDLTSAAFASLRNGSQLAEEEKTAIYDKDKQYLEDYEKHTQVVLEENAGVAHAGTHGQRLRACYYIAVTYKNAILDIRDYYKIRYLYANNLDYEMGYIIQEIVHHYQIAVELYHLILKKYGMNRNRHYAPTTYMLYMYTNILHQCTTIIHLCNMLHELEAKYKDNTGSIFQADQQGASNPYMDAVKAYQEKLLAEKKLQKEEERKRKELFKAGRTTTRTRRPRKGPFPLHYGWSIEYW